MNKYYIFIRNMVTAFIVLIVIALQSNADIASASLINLATDLEPIRASHSFPALAAAVMVDGKLHAVGVCGVRKYGTSIKAEIDDSFHLGSCTKAMTASMICLLIQEGKLKWDTTLAEYFPEWKETMHPDYRKVTVVHLLSHRAGTPSMTHDINPFTEEEHNHLKTIRPYPAQRKWGMEKLLSCPPINKPGEDRVYSNAGFALAGMIAETVMHKSWEDLMQEKLFRPLDMKTAGYGPMGTPGKTDAPWQHETEDGKIIPVPPLPENDNPYFYAPGGLVHCSLPDWAKYIQCILKAVCGEKGLLDPAMVKSIMNPPFNDTYALGWEITGRGWGDGNVITHGGSNGKNYCVVWIAPAKNFAVMAATNIGGDNAAQGCDEVCGSMIEKFCNNHQQ